MDYRHLNQNTVKDKTPLPIMQELRERLKGADFITKVGPKAGFQLIRMLLGHEKYTVCRTKFGLFEYTVMPFSLTYAAATFQREINRILRPALGNEIVINHTIHINEDEGMVVVAYIDDIIMPPKGSVKKHRRQGRKLFDLLLENQMCIEIDKCVFEQSQTSFLGFMVSSQSIRMDPAKAQDIVDWPRPTNLNEVKQILGLWQFYGRFIPSYAQIVASIRDLFKGNGKYSSFAEAQEAAFLKIVVLFTSGKTPILRHFDQERPALIEIDAEDFAIGAVLWQKFEDRKIQPGAFLSQKLSPAEFHEVTFDKEMLRIIDAVQMWRHYVLGTEHKSTIFSDHQNLEYFTKKVKLNRSQAKWAEILMEFDFVIDYRKGSLNQKADIISRCLAYTIREGDTTANSEQPMLGPDQWLEVRAMEIYDETLKYIDIGALEITLLSLDQKEAFIQDAMLDEEYMQLCKAVSKEENVDSNYTIKEG